MRRLRRFVLLLELATICGLALLMFLFLGEILDDAGIAGRVFRIATLLLLTILSIGIGVFIGHAVSMKPGRVKHGPFRGLYRMGLVQLDELRMRLTLAMLLPMTPSMFPGTEGETKEEVRARAVMAVLGLPDESHLFAPPDQKPAKRSKRYVLPVPVAAGIREQLTHFHGYSDHAAEEILGGYEHHGALTPDEINGKELADPFDRWTLMMRRYQAKELVEAAMAHINTLNPPALVDTAQRADLIAAWVTCTYGIMPFKAEEEAIYYLADGDPLEAHHLANLRPMSPADRFTAIDAMYPNLRRRRAALADAYIELSTSNTKS